MIKEIIAWTILAVAGVIIGIPFLIGGGLVLYYGFRKENLPVTIPLFVVLLTFGALAWAITYLFLQDTDYIKTNKENYD